MAKSKPAAAVDAVKDFWNSQVGDEDKWAVNSLFAFKNGVIFYARFKQKMLRAFGLFAGSIFLMRDFGELMAI